MTPWAIPLGDKEAKTRNKILAPVQENTEKLADFYKNKEIPLTFEMNKGCGVSRCVAMER